MSLYQSSMQYKLKSQLGSFLSSMFILWVLHVEFYITHVILKEMIAVVKKNYLFCYYHDKEWMNWPAHTHFYFFFNKFCPFINKQIGKKLEISIFICSLCFLNPMRTAPFLFKRLSGLCETLNWLKMVEV